MNTRSREPYWLLKNGIQETFPSLQKPITCDILIVGAGITGALMAYQLCKEGQRVVLVDKRDLAFGSTSATTALLQYEIDDPLITLSKKVGGSPARAAYKEGVVAIHKLEKIVNNLKIQCGFARKKSLFLARTKKDANWMKDEFEARVKIGLPVKWLSKNEIENTYAVTSEGGIESSVGASIDAFLFTYELVRYCQEKFQLHVYDHTEVATITYGENKQHIAHVNNDIPITFQHVIYATGYEAKVPTRKKVVKLVSTYALATEPITDLPPSFKDTIFWDTQQPYFYLRSTDDNRLLVGGGDEKFKNAIKRDLLIGEKEIFLSKQLKSLCPTINAIVDFSWAGTFGVTRDALPYIGADPKNPDTYFVLGYGGNGITFSVMGMEIISDLIAGRVNPLAEYFKLNR